MNKQARETITMAEAEGLKFCGVEARSKHEFLIFENKDGLQYWQPLHRSGYESTSIHKINNKRTFKNFASGKLEGLERMIREGKTSHGKAI